MHTLYVVDFYPIQIQYQKIVERGMSLLHIRLADATVLLFDGSSLLQATMKEQDILGSYLVTLPRL